MCAQNSCKIESLAYDKIACEIVVVQVYVKKCNLIVIISADSTCIEGIKKLELFMKKMKISVFFL